MVFSKFYDDISWRFCDYSCVTNEMDQENFGRPQFNMALGQNEAWRMLWIFDPWKFAPINSYISKMTVKAYFFTS